MVAVEQTFPSLREASYGLDRTWWKDAACHAWIRRDNVPTPWNVATTDTPLSGVPCHKLVDLALLICAGCKAQYDCARYAVQGREIACTWGLRIKLLLWLQRQPDALDIIDQAQLVGETVQVFVRGVKRSRAGD